MPCPEELQYTAKLCSHCNTKCHPIAFWTDEDVANYIKKHGLPVNPIYKMGFERTGCLPCTTNIKWREQLARANPNLLNYILKKRGTPGLLEYLELTTPGDGYSPCRNLA